MLARSWRWNVITPPAAKKIIERELIARSVPFTKLAAQTVHFTDFARTSRIFVKIHGWQPNPVWGELKGLLSHTASISKPRYSGGRDFCENCVPRDLVRSSRRKLSPP